MILRSCISFMTLRTCPTEGFYQSVAISSSSARLQASQNWSFFSHIVCVIVLIGMSSVHFSGSPIDEGAGTNCLISGHGKPTGFSLDLHVDRMYDDKQL